MDRLFPVRQWQEWRTKPMGWCSATEIFDDVAGFVLATEKDDRQKVEVLKRLANALENQDWDCQQDSDYWNYPIIQEVMKALHPDWEVS